MDRESTSHGYFQNDKFIGRFQDLLNQNGWSGPPSARGRHWLVVDASVLSGDHRRFGFRRILLDKCEPNLGNHVVAGGENNQGPGPQAI